MKRDAAGDKEKKHYKWYPRHCSPDASLEGILTTPPVNAEIEKTKIDGSTEAVCRAMLSKSEES